MCHFCLILCHSLSHSISHSVSQDPTLFPGTLCSNLDPSGMLTDEQLWGILDQVGLRDHVAGIHGDLSVDVGKDATLFSLGQRQLLYLARALVRRTKLLVFDEATESIEHGWATTGLFHVPLRYHWPKKACYSPPPLFSSSGHCLAESWCTVCAYPYLSVTRWTVIVTQNSMVSCSHHSGLQTEGLHSG